MSRMAQRFLAGFGVGRRAAWHLGRAEHQQKTPALFRARGSSSTYGLAVTYFRVRNCTLSSAQTRFTVLFGMGRGGSRLLWPPDWSWARRFGAVTPRSAGRDSKEARWDFEIAPRLRDCLAHGYRVKPHGQLVRVSSRPYGPCTSRLSTSWSRTTLQGGQASGKSYLGARFPLRCFQRLSLPHIATRRCHWRDNRYTRDASTPVLSY